MTPRKSTAGKKAYAWHGFTDRGRVRTHNEDAFIGLCFDDREVMRLGKIGDGLFPKMDLAFAVSDGVGGSAAGEFASRVAVEKIMTLLPRGFRKLASKKEAAAKAALPALYAEIHKALRFLGESYDETTGMEATLSVVWLAGGRAFFAHIGDSRIYYLAANSKTAIQLSEDDTHVAWLLRHNKISAAEAMWHPGRKVLQKALGGTHQFVEPQTGVITFGPGDTLLLCTDGLIEGLDETRLASVIRNALKTAGKLNPAELLVRDSVQNSGRDNATALLVRSI